LGAELEPASGCRFELLQVKEKFGELRIRVNGANDDIRQRIEAAERGSFQAHEVCGQPGALREGEWIRALCDEHTTMN
jgi:hypothetical protein